MQNISENPPNAVPPSGLYLRSDLLNANAMEFLKRMVKILLLPALFIITGCSEENNSGDSEEFLTALIDGQEFCVTKLNGTIKCEKQLTEFGTINLSVKVLSAEGKSIEFLLQNYLGKQLYSMGERTNSVEGSFAVGHWINYTQRVPQEFWSSVYDNYTDSELENYIEITEDNGNSISGKFTSENFQSSGTLAKIIEDGTFNLRISE